MSELHLDSCLIEKVVHHELGRDRWTLNDCGSQSALADKIGRGQLCVTKHSELFTCDITAAVECIKKWIAILSGKGLSKSMLLKALILGLERPPRLEDSNSVAATLDENLDETQEETQEESEPEHSLERTTIKEFHTCTDDIQPRPKSPSSRLERQSERIEALDRAEDTGAFDSSASHLLPTLPLRLAKSMHFCTLSPKASNYVGTQETDQSDNRYWLRSSAQVPGKPS